MGHRVKQELEDQQQEPKFNNFEEFSNDILPSENDEDENNKGYVDTFSYEDVEFNPAAVEAALQINNSPDDVASQIFLDAERMAQLEREFHEQVS